jgi:hypothetical protein
MTKDKMTVAIPVLLACPTADTTGDHIGWSPGQRATFLGNKGPRPVTIMTGKFVGHDAVPNQLCLEVTFDDENDVAGCVLASALRLR